MGFWSGSDRRLFVSLFPEEGPEICKHEGCNRKRDHDSVLCAVHHFEVIKEEPCPWDDEYSELSEKEKALIERKRTRANLYQKKSEPKAMKPRGKAIDKKCPKCGSDMRAINRTNWLTIGAIVGLPPLGFILFIITGIVEKQAICPHCLYEETLYRVF